MRVTMAQAQAQVGDLAQPRTLERDHNLLGVLAQVYVDDTNQPLCGLRPAPRASRPSSPSMTLAWRRTA